MTCFALRVNPVLKSQSLRLHWKKPGLIGQLDAITEEANGHRPHLSPSP